jgi:hypothetical protein
MALASQNWKDTQRQLEIELEEAKRCSVSGVNVNSFLDSFI